MKSIAFIAVLLGWFAYASAETINGRVVSVHDGDTITVVDASKMQHKIRLAGIDAPELKQAFGVRSKKNLSDLVYNKQIKVEWEKRDKYKRIIGKVFFSAVSCLVPECHTNTDANYEQIAAGMAWHYKQYEKDQTREDRGSYAAAEI